MSISKVLRHFLCFGVYRPAPDLSRNFCLIFPKHLFKNIYKREAQTCRVQSSKASRTTQNNNSRNYWEASFRL